MTVFRGISDLQRRGTPKMKTTLPVLIALMTIPAWPASHAQSSRPTLAENGGNPFAGAVEAIKRSVAPLVCLAVKGGETTVVSRPGSVFFVSAGGDFLTAAHVLREQMNDHQCPVSAITLPLEGWQPKALDEPTTWFAFKITSCAIDEILDVAVCRPTTDLRQISKVKIAPVQFDWDIPADGTPVAFTGFPRALRDPMTFQAGVAADRPVWRDGKAIDEVVLDRSALPGFSGSPVFLPNGRVVGMLVSGAADESNTLTFLRPAAAWRAMLAEGVKK
ncbi:MAG: hypothetical protein C5B51_02430 [Terriglobia bacterium]|nr:MAG: hypothetical protein C5B51_02430 [Terriglobia bacterium]